MYHLVYTSHAKHEFSEADLIELLMQCRSFNRKHDITGMLLYLNGKFIQVLEGAKTEVERLFAMIEKDPRHTRVTLVIQGSSPERVFPGWTMGFKKLTFEDAQHLSGFQDIDIFFREQLSNKNRHLLLVFLGLFYKNNIVDYAQL